MGNTTRRDGDGADPVRLIVAITGASGFVYGVRLLELLRRLDVQTHLIVSRSAQTTMAYETGLKLADVVSLADRHLRNDDLAACVSSGSYRTLGMVVAPCSMKTLAEIATGATSTLIGRAADVVLKERRRLVLLARETPLHAGHLKNMLAVTEMGAIVAPPVPAFYARPATLDDMVEHTLGRVLDLFGLETGTVRRWQGSASGAGGRPGQVDADGRDRDGSSVDVDRPRRADNPDDADRPSRADSPDEAVS